MLKAVLLDLDETLCATSKANDDALTLLCSWLKDRFPSLEVERFGERYVKGFYKQLNDEFPELKVLLGNESAFRHRLIVLLFEEQGLVLNDVEAAEINRRLIGLVWLVLVSSWDRISIGSSARAIQVDRDHQWSCIFTTAED